MLPVAHIKKVALIGSFRQHYQAVLEAWRRLTAIGVEITTPKGGVILEEGIDFVRFDSDPASLDNFSIQSTALHRICRADLVYGVLPSGYVGRTTCYELGRIIQAQRPIYFSDVPCDLPIKVTSDRIISLDDLVELIQNPTWNPTPMHSLVIDEQDELERDLINGHFRTL